MSNNETPPSTPCWVNTLGITIVIILILLFAILNMFGIGGNHGPGRHFSSNLSDQHIQRAETGIIII